MSAAAPWIAKVVRYEAAAPPKLARSSVYRYLGALNTDFGVKCEPRGPCTAVCDWGVFNRRALARRAQGK
jgi:hypothetical protein